VHQRTRESLLVCEAAGYDVVLVETVGVGQSETAVSDMVDTFVVLMLAGAGDGLQGIKRGILELAEVIAVNKADGDNAPKAMRARAEYARALRLVRPTSAHWRTPVRTCSGLTGIGIDDLWETIQQHRGVLVAAGALETRRAGQRSRWLQSMLREGLVAAIGQHPAVEAIREDVEREVVAGRMTAARGAARLLSAAGLKPGNR
jgi:LAO/AO transport system kinase